MFIVEFHRNVRVCIMVGVMSTEGRTDGKAEV